MRSSVLIGVLFYFLLSSCAGSEQAQVKVGGAGEISGSDPINRYTVMVRMSIDREKGINHPSSCSGTLLDSRHVLLATHCIGGNIWRVKVLVGYDNKVLLADGREFSAIGEGASFVLSKSYLSKWYNASWRIFWNKITFRSLSTRIIDIAVIRLAKPLDLPYPIDYEIPEPTVDLTGKEVAISGYGIGDMGQKPLKARKALVKVAKDYKKSDLLEFTNFFRRVNYGDSGGPVWWRDKQGKLNLIGVHSFGITMVPLVRIYTYSIDIRHHRQWIKNALQVLQENDPQITEKMNMSKRYFPGYLEDFHKNNSQSRK